MQRKSAFTLIELMIVVIVVAILAAAAVPIYGAVVSRAYDAEVTQALSAFCTAERNYRTGHDKYADLPTLGAAGLIRASDFADMRYVQYGDFSIPSSADDSFTIRWDRPASGDVADYDYSSVTMDEDGKITRTK